MDATHSGHWKTTRSEPGDLIFSSEAPAHRLVLTVSKKGDPPPTIEVQVNGVVAANGGMMHGDLSRTFCFSDVSTIHIVNAPASTSTGATGDYTITFQ
jgi:hypothetical protein